MLLVDILIWCGIFTPLRSIWMILEDVFDNGVQESISDSLMSIIFVTIVWWQVRKWIAIKESEAK